MGMSSLHLTWKYWGIHTTRSARIWDGSHRIWDGAFTRAPSGRLLLREGALLTCVTPYDTVVRMTTHDTNEATSDSLGTRARTVRFPTALSEQLEDLANDRDRSFSHEVITACRAHVGASSRAATREELEVEDGDGEPPTVELVPRHSYGDGIGYHAVLVEGIEVPHLKVAELEPGTNGGLEHERSYVLSVDDRFGTIAVPYAELWRWLWIMAQAMAVSAGFTCHGENARLSNPHGPALPLWDPVGGRCSPACKGGHATETPERMDPVGASKPFHTVQPGDTLWGIAGEHLGDSNRWPEIVALNFDTIRTAAEAHGTWDEDDPGHWIFSGTVLRLTNG